MAGVCVFLILVLFKPFGFGAAAGDQFVLHAFYYGLVTFLLSSANAVFFPILFPKFFNEMKWTVGRELLMMLWQILCITFGNLLLTHYLYGMPLSWHSLLNYLFITLAVGIFPITLVIMWKQQALLKKYSSVARILDEGLKLELPAVPETGLNFIHFVGDNKEEQLSVLPGDLRYIVSADNYVRIYYLNKGQLHGRVFRTTLKKLEEFVRGYPQLFRCHRSYIVNLVCVQHVSGNAQGFKLHLVEIDEPIPVSRSLNRQLAELLQQHSRSSVHP
jgi:DNA-binding LytR/AlgR family response regulator